MLGYKYEPQLNHHTPHVRVLVGEGIDISTKYVEYHVWVVLDIYWEETFMPFLKSISIQFTHYTVDLNVKNITLENTWNHNNSHLQTRTFVPKCPFDIMHIGSFNGLASNMQQSSTKIIDHYDDVIMTMLASQITSLTVVYSIVYSGVNQRKHQSSASLAFVREIHRGPVNFPHKWPVTRKMFPFDDVIMEQVHWRIYAWRSNVLTIEAETKWPPFRRRDFQIHFHEWKCMNFDYDFTEFCS